jgi:hypothetical protein
MASSLSSFGSPHQPHMVVNLLSSSQSDTAVYFSRPDKYPDPFRDTPFNLSAEGIPVLTGSLGAFSCALLSSILLDQDTLANYGLSRKEIHDGEALLGDSGLGSQLFLARIMRTENTIMEKRRPRIESLEDEEGKLPLVYHHRRYTTVTETDGESLERPQKWSEPAPVKISRSLMS